MEPRRHALVRDVPRLVRVAGRQGNREDALPAEVRRRHEHGLRVRRPDQGAGRPVPVAREPRDVEVLRVGVRDVEDVAIRLVIDAVHLHPGDFLAGGGEPRRRRRALRLRVPGAAPGVDGHGVLGGAVERDVVDLRAGVVCQGQRDVLGIEDDGATVRRDVVVALVRLVVGAFRRRHVADAGNVVSQVPRQGV